ncbi:hypothetical protein V6Z12_D05G370500 [Gossypium hirsutum]
MFWVGLDFAFERSRFNLGFELLKQLETFIHQLIS